MKKTIVSIIMAGLFCLGLAVSTNAALTLPSVTQDQGSIGGTIVFDEGLCIDWDYGLNSELGVKLELGLEGGYELGIKYELNKNAAVTGGVCGYNDESAPYIGFIGSTLISSDLLGLGEISVIATSDVVFHYELGMKYSFDRNLALRFGLTGYTGDAGGNVDAQIGLQYAF